MKLVTRAEWGARAPRSRSTKSLTQASTAHWNGNTVTVNGQKTWDHSKCAALVRGTQNFHMDGRGWSDIAYNFLTCPHGYVFEGRGLNVINGANGTNAANATSHAITCISGEGNDFPDSQKSGFRDCVAYIADRTAAPDRCVGHRDHKSTACPGDARYNWVHQGMPVAASTREDDDTMVGLGKVAGTDPMYMVYPTGDGEMVRKHIETEPQFWMYAKTGVIREGQKCAELTGDEAKALIALRQVR